MKVVLLRLSLWYLGTVIHDCRGWNKTGNAVQRDRLEFSHKAAFKWCTKEKFRMSPF
jgi:hypothetical protein